MFSISQQSEFIEKGDPARVGPYPATVTGYRKQDAWSSTEWMICLWVPALAREVWLPVEDVVLQ